VASELHLSSRTLQRRLQQNVYSFQQAVEEARQDLARHYLIHSPLELNETAYLLEYEVPTPLYEHFMPGKAFHPRTGGKQSE
jgi:transcriptional regulator GlxA family with amidase domain